MTKVCCSEIQIHWFALIQLFQDNDKNCRLNNYFKSLRMADFVEEQFLKKNKFSHVSGRAH